MEFKSDYKKVASYEGTPNEGDSVLLLYSGGLDTSVMLKWLQDIYKVKVYALCVNIGQREDFDPIVDKAIKLGAEKCEVVDAVERFAVEVCNNAIFFNADYEGGYHLFCPLGRVMISRIAVEYAEKWNCKFVCHGATGKGNDQIRFDSYVTTLNPDLKILAPVREWAMGREEEIEYAKKNNIPVGQSLEKIYSYDENLWGCSAEGGEIEDFKKVPPLDKILKFTNLPETAPDQPEYIKLIFKEGFMVGLECEVDKFDSINNLSGLIKAINTIGKRHGIGITHLIEDRVLGLKVRGVYEEPGAEIIIQAHRALEKAVSTREEIIFKENVDRQWSQLVYEGRWFHPLMSHLSYYAYSVSQKVTGTVTLRLYKGRAETVAVDSNNCLNNEASSFMKDSKFNQNSSAGFIENFNYTQKLTYTMTKERRNEQ